MEINGRYIKGGWRAMLLYRMDKCVNYAKYFPFKSSARLNFDGYGGSVICTILFRRFCIIGLTGVGNAVRRIENEGKGQKLLRFSR